MVNQNFFKKWSPESAYVLGFFAADGNMIKTKRNTHFISFHTKDKKLLQKIKQAMSSDHKISIRKGVSGNLFRIQIGSKEMFNDLGEMGFVPGKTNRMRVPKMPKRFQPHFIRGYFDGDGNIWVGEINKQRSKSTKVLQIAFTSCNKRFLEDIWSTVRSFGVSGGSLYDPTAKNYARLMFSTNDSLKLAEVMYNEAPKLFLERKKLRFQQFKELRA